MTATSRQRIGFWASAEKKQQFAALAASKDMTESELLALLVDHVLGTNPPPAPARELSTDEDGHEEGTTERVTLRLRPGDRRQVEARAAQRKMRPGSYLVALIHAHLRRQAPLPVAELNQLKVAVGELSAVGRNLNQLARAANAGQVSAEGLPTTLQAALQQVDEVRRQVADLVRVNIMSWEAGHG